LVTQKQACVMNSCLFSAERFTAMMREFVA
jgi:hypothetical protein